MGREMRGKMLAIGLLPCLLAACFDQGADPEQPEHGVSILDNRFDPTELTLPVNGSLVFIHRGVENHTVTVRLPGGPQEEYLFDVADPGLMQGNRVSLQFPGPGEYVVHCRYHSNGNEGMLMAVTVT